MRRVSTPKIFPTLNTNADFRLVTPNVLKSFYPHTTRLLLILFFPSSDTKRAL
jgi:hypothetical protein